MKLVRCGGARGWPYGLFKATVQPRIYPPMARATKGSHPGTTLKICPDLLTRGPTRLLSVDPGSDAPLPRATTSAPDSVDGRVRTSITSLKASESA